MDSLYVIRERMQDLYSRYSIVADKAIQFVLGYAFYASIFTQNLMDAQVLFRLFRVKTAQSHTAIALIVFTNFCEL